MSKKLKPGSKVIGWDDGPFTIGQTDTVPLVGVITRGNGQVDGIIKTEIEVDGMEVGEKISRAINSSKHKEELRLIITDGITFGGFNVLELDRLARNTGLPVLAVTRKKVNFDDLREAVKHLSHYEERWRKIQTAGKLESCVIDGREVHYQTSSLTADQAENALRKTLRGSSVPEAVRLADMIARAYVVGES